MTAIDEHDRLTVEVATGRSVEVLTGGPPDGLTLVFHSGTPAGLVAFTPLIDAAATRGLRTVLYARPGYGGSDPQPGRQVADAAVDVAAILDRLDAESFVTAGWSGGGPHALASAALLPERCLAVATIAGVAPYAAAGLDWLAGMAADNVAEYAAAAAGESAITSLLLTFADLLAQISAEEVGVSLRELASPVDQAALTGEYAAYLAESFRAALSSGIAGWRDDDLAFVRDWGVSLAELGSAVPVSIWQGDQDAMVPFAHGRWLASQIPLARAHLLSGEGHLTLGVTRIGAILDELVELAVLPRT
jgi:pimeloyl-ACP methyl ester carboxylesterase